MIAKSVIKVDSEKCVNCHQCISVCPVKFCQDGSGDTVKILTERCIGCGSCITACEHEARIRIDDWDEFIESTKSGDKIVAIVAPAVAASFEGNVLNLNGFLKSLGIQAVFDVSFGAELTIYSYLEHIKMNNPVSVISQPCPAIVNYIELYQPQLIPYLAPADSPMLHTIKMIKTFYKKYENYKIAAVSPCLSKRTEFEKTGLGDFNITFTAIEKYLANKKLNLKNFEKVEFDSPIPERAVLFSTPGGLKATLEREAPGVLDLVRKIEGSDIIYEYLDTFQQVVNKKAQPLIVDCLNCEKGCNGGTGTSVYDMPVDILENAVQKRSLETRKIYSHRLKNKTAQRKMKKILKKYWQPGLYARSYTDRSRNININVPDNKQKWEIFNSMMKNSDADLFNCTSCGYGSCNDMAKAIFNGLNKAENCHHFKLELLENGKKKISQISDQLHQKINSANELVMTVSSLVENKMQGTEEQSAAVKESSAAVEQLITSIQNINALVRNRKAVITELQEDSQNGSEAMIKTVSSVQQVFDKVDKIKGVNQTINDVAANTNLLAMNAAIEAAHAGNSGKGFAVVASEIRNLAEKTAENAKIISTDLLGIANDVQETKDISQRTGTGIQQIVVSLNTVAESFEELSTSMEQMASGSYEIQVSLEQMQKSSQNLKDFGSQVNSTIADVTSFYTELHQISEENIKAL